MLFIDQLWMFLSADRDPTVWPCPGHILKLIDNAQIKDWPPPPSSPEQSIHNRLPHAAAGIVTVIYTCMHVHCTVCMHACAYICVCVCVYSYACVLLCMYLCLYLYVCIHVCVCVYIYIHVCLCMNACMCVFMYVFINLHCIYVCMQLQLCMYLGL